MSATRPAAAAPAAAAALTRPIRCAIYLRISLDRGKDGLAVDRQREACHRIARERGWIITEEYVDNSISAYSKTVKRPSYERLRKDYAAGAFEAIVCWDLDRLTRQPRQLEDWIDASEERGLQLVTANGECDLATTGGVLFAGIKAQVARSEMKQKSVRQQAALAQRADHGRPPLGRPAFGYLSNGKANEAEAPYVLDIFTRFTAGESLLSIAGWLNERQVPSRQQGRGGAARKGWWPATVRHILSNPRYAGRVVYRGQVVEGKAATWDVLVEPELWAAAERILTDPRRLSNRTGTHRKHLGAGLYLCGRCGQRMQSHSGDAYRCQQNACMTKGRVKVDEYVMAYVAAELARDDLAQLLMRPDSSSKAAEVEAQVATLQRKLATANAQIEDPETEDEDLPGLRRRRRNIEEALTRLYAERAELWAVAGDNAILAAEHPDEAFLAASLGMQRMVLDTLFTVTLLPGVRGKWALDPATVRIEYRPR